MNLPAKTKKLLIALGQSANDDTGVYGLDLAQQTGLATGTITLHLARLERKNLAESRWENEDWSGTEVTDKPSRPRRRYYRLTPTGRELFMHNEA